MPVIFDPFTGQLIDTGPAGGPVIGGPVAGADPNSVLVVDSALTLQNVQMPTDGQLLIGSAGNLPVASTLTQASASQVVITNGPGSITLGLPQNISSADSPSFTGLTLSSLSGPVKAGVGGALSSSAIDLATSEVTNILTVDKGGTGVNGSAAPNGHILIGNGAGYTLADILGTTNQVNITNGAGSIQLSLPQDIHTGASPEFSNLSLAGTLDTAVLGGTLGVGTNKASIINIGNPTATVNIQGTTIYQNVTNLNVTDKNITVNVNGSVGSGGGAGIHVEEGGVSNAGHAEVTGDRLGWEFHPPGVAGIAYLYPGASGITLNQSSHDPVTINATPNGLGIVNQVLSLELASASSTGALSSSDWSTFNNTTSYVDAQVLHVSKNGNDTTGTGGQHKPYLTLAKAFSMITDASPSKRYVVRVAAGAYNEVSIALPANVFVVGESKESVRITGNVTMGAWTQDNAGSDDRSGFSMLTIIGTADFNWSTVKSRAGKLYFNEAVFSSTVNLYGYDNSIAQAQFDSCWIIGNLTISGINIGLFTNNFCSGNITLNQHPNGGMPTILTASGGQCNGTLTSNAAVNDFGRRCSLFAKNFYMEYVSLNGPSSYADMNDASLPRGRDRITSSGGANLVPISTKAPLINNSQNIGETGYQYLYNFSYVHGSTDTDLYLISMGNSYGSAGTGRSIFIESDTWGLNSNVNGGDINLTTATTSGTGVRGKIKLDGREIDVSDKKITNLANGSADKDAVNKSQLDTKQDYIAPGLSTEFYRGDKTFAKVNLTSDVTGILPFTSGGLGFNTYSGANRVIGFNGANNALEGKQFISGTGINIGHGAGSITLTNTIASSSDIGPSSLTGLLNNTAGQPITGLSFSASVLSFIAFIDILIDATTDLYAYVEVRGKRKESVNWSTNDVQCNFVGDAIEGLNFDITSVGQVIIDIGSIAGYSSGSLKFRAFALG